MRKTLIRVAGAAALALAPLAPATAADTTLVIVIKDHMFEPAEVKVPAGERVKLVVENRDPTPEEFESHALHLEKVIAGGATATLWIGPLPKGSYEFVGEFHEASAKGTIVAE